MGAVTRFSHGAHNMLVKRALVFTLKYEHTNLDGNSLQRKPILPNTLAKCQIHISLIIYVTFAIIG